MNENSFWWLPVCGVHRKILLSRIHVNGNDRKLGKKVFKNQKKRNTGNNANRNMPVQKNKAGKNVAGELNKMN